jgi:hypothetical protein
MTPALAIQSLVCGYSREDRNRKVLFMLTAYSDDSASSEDEESLVLAAYVHRATTWTSFSDDWKPALDANPAIEYFKMSEAESLKGQFLGWDRTDVDKKISALADVIVEYEPWSIASRVSRRDFDDIMAPVVPYDIRTPYFSCFYALIINLAKWHAHMGLSLPVDFIFDEQGKIGAEAVVWYEYIKSIQPPEVAKLLGSSPVFKDDKLILPLQAADLLAWHLRRSGEERNKNESRPIFEKLIPILHAEVPITKDALRKMAQQMSEVPGVEHTREKRDSIRYLIRKKQDK